MIRIIVLSIVLMLSQACNQSNRSSTIEWEGGIIDDVGAYEITDEGIIVTVIEQNKTLVLSVRNREGDDLITRQKLGSTLHRWFMYWDTNSNLWVYNSDIGGFIWAKAQNMEYVSTSLMEDKTLLSKCPFEFRERIPKSYLDLLSN